MLDELESLSDKGVYERDKICWWLLKHEERYKGLSNMRDVLKAEFPNSNLRVQKSFILELLFIELFSDIENIVDEDNLENDKINDVIKKIRSSTNGLRRKDKDFKWDSTPRE